MGVVALTAAQMGYLLEAIDWRNPQQLERTAHLLDQLELTLEELDASATEDKLAAGIAAIKVTNASTIVASFTRQRPSRKPLPEHLPRERVIVAGPVSCACFCGARLSKLGEDITETLEVIFKSWKVIQHVWEKFSCRGCEKISQAPAPFHVIARGWAGPSLLAMVMFEKLGQHLLHDKASSATDQHVGGQFWALTHF